MSENELPKKKKIGRPIEHDIEKHAQALEEWMVKDTSNHLTEFAIERGVPSEQLYRWRDQSELFRYTLNKARDYLCIRTRKKINDPNAGYHERLAMRDITNYDILLKKEERKDKEFKSSLKQKEAEKLIKDFQPVVINFADSKEKNID